MESHTMTRRKPGLPRRRHDGFTLIESLVALLVLSIGLLGVAAMQLSSLQANNGAFQRTQATFLAQDIADRMRANRRAALDGEYDMDYGDAAPNAPATVAENDIVLWKNRLAATLPAAASGEEEDAPDAQIVTNVADETVTIRIRWDDSRGAEAAQEFAMRTRL
jgi:type IV pilus assembly protein PilV